MFSHKKSRRNLLVLVSLCLSGFCSCQTSSLTIEAEPKEATLAQLNERDANASPRSLGKLPFALSGDQTRGAVYAIDAPGMERTLMVFPGFQQDTILKFRLRPAAEEERRKLAEAEASLGALRKQLEEQKKESNEMQGKIASTIRDLLQVQRYISLQALADAEPLLANLHSLPENFRPAQAYVLRGKVRMMKGNRAEARSDFEKALQMSPGDLETKSLLDQVK